MTSKKSIFSKIIDREIPASIVYEDSNVIAFLDINPLSDGHTLVVPKIPVARLDQLPADAAAAIGRVLPKLCRAIIQAVGYTDYNVLQNNGPRAHQAVPHVHFHIIPKPTASADEGTGLGIHWPVSKMDSDHAKLLAESIRKNLTA